MAILIDEARWWFQGRKWCHMVSDLSYAELIEFADGVGIPRRGFQGDHYDIPEEYRADMIAAGAVVVESRDLVRRLRGAGLRLSPTERRARSAMNVVPSLFDDLWASDRDRQNRAFREVLELTDQPVGWADQVWDDVVGHLADEDNHNRSIAAQVTANLSVSAPDRILGDFAALADVTRDERFVTARHALQALWRIGTIGPQHRAMLVEFLVQRFHDAGGDKNTTLIRADIIEALARLYSAAPHPSIENTANDLIAVEPDDKYRKKYSTIWRRTSMT